MTPPEHLTSWSRDALLALVAVLQHQVAALTAANEAWRADMARRTREAQRPAAPFAKGTRVATPQRPGRQPGAGPFHYREATLPEQLSAPPAAGPVKHAA